MINEYSRTELLIGSENMEKLKKASVAVFGVGGADLTVSKHWQGAVSGD